MKSGNEIIPATIHAVGSWLALPALVIILIVPGAKLGATDFVSLSYTVQRNDDLATTNWVYQTNLTGNGALMQVFAPVTAVPHRFFRVRQP